MITIVHSSPYQRIQDGKGVIIVDAGGGTIDISSYLFLSTSPVSVEEVTSPECESSLETIITSSLTIV